MWYRLSLDLENIIKTDHHDDDENYGYGTEGEYFTKFDKDKKKKLIDSLGQVDHDQGYKIFYKHLPNDAVAMENLALIFLAPYIRSHSSLQTPAAGSAVSFSNLFANRFISTQNLSGVIIHTFSHKYGMYDFYEWVEQQVQNEIKQILHNIGCKILDLHGENFKLDPKKLDNISKAYISYCDKAAMRKDNLRMLQGFFSENKPLVQDLASDARLFDFGMARCTKAVAVECGLMDFKNKLQQNLFKYPKNGYIEDILEAINTIILY